MCMDLIFHVQEFLFLKVLLRIKLDHSRTESHASFLYLQAGGVGQVAQA